MILCRSYNMLVEIHITGCDSQLGCFRVVSTKRREELLYLHVEQDTVGRPGQALPSWHVKLLQRAAILRERKSRQLRKSWVWRWDLGGILQQHYTVLLSFILCYEHLILCKYLTSHFDTVSTKSGNYRLNIYFCKMPAV